MRAQPDVHRHIIEVVNQLAGVLPTGAAVIDLGCGPGHHAVALAERGFAVTAVDFASAMLDRGRGKAQKSSLAVTFLQADLNREWPLPHGGFDGALCVGVLQLIADPGAFLARVRDRLRPGGHALVEVVLPGASVAPDDHYLRLADRAVNRLKLVIARAPGAIRRYQPAELSSLLEGSGLSVVKSRTYDRTYTILSRR